MAAYSPYVERMANFPAPLLDDYEKLVDQGVVHVAVVDDQVLGVIVMWEEADHFYVDNVAVVPAAQGLGVGAELLAEADRAARAAGRDEIRLYTNVAMTENSAYYVRRGFVETHRASDDGYDRVFFARSVWTGLT